MLFLGVAASSAFLDQRDVRLSPGESVEVDDYEVTYREPTARLGGDDSGTGAPISFGAVLDVRKDGERFMMRPLRNYYASGDPSLGAISRFFEGEATSEVDVRWGLTRDLWMAVRPDLGALEEPIREADRRFADSPGEVQALIVAAIAERYRDDPPPAAFRVIVSPMVAWIWIGGGDRACWARCGRLAVAGGAAAASALALRGAARPRALAGRSAPWSTPSPCWSLALPWSPSCCRLARCGARRGASAATRRRRRSCEAAKEAKYREIRDAELDHQMGKLSRRGLARRRPRAARRGDRDPARAGPARGTAAPEGGVDR